MKHRQEKKKRVWTFVAFRYCFALVSVSLPSTAGKNSLLFPSDSLLTDLTIMLLQGSCGLIASLHTWLGHCTYCKDPNCETVETPRCHIRRERILKDADCQLQRPFLCEYPNPDGELLLPAQQNGLVSIVK